MRMQWDTLHKPWMKPRIGQRTPRLPRLARLLFHFVPAMQCAMRLPFAHRPLLAFLLAALLNPLSAQEPATTGKELRWRWQLGKTYRFQTETETVLSLPGSGEGGDKKKDKDEEEVAEQILQVIQNTEVKVQPGRDATRKDLVVRFTTLRARLSAQGKIFLYDSENPSESDPALRGLLADSSGTEFTLVYSTDDTFIETGKVEQPATRPDQEPSLLAVADMRQVAELYRRSLEMGLPRTAVAPGDKWISSEKVTFPQAGEMEVRMNCHFQETMDRAGSPHAKVTFQGKLKQDAALTGDPITVKAVTLGAGSSLAGQVFFDFDRQAISLSMFLGSLVMVHEGKNLPVRHTVTTRLEEMLDTPES